MSGSCRLCESERGSVFRALVLGRHDVEYFYCQTCGLMQTEEPHWLDEAYQDAIADADTGLIARNVNISRVLSSVLLSCFDPQGTYIDAAGGYGILTRLMRDIGFDFYWTDEYCQNLFAKGFDVTQAVGSVAAVTAFEVLEHVADPLEFIRCNLRAHDTGTIILSTELFAGPPPAPQEWWYYSLETGQHISFYQARTLQYIADKLSLKLYSNRNIHVLTDKNFSNWRFFMAAGELSRLVHIIAKLCMTSRKFPDHHLIKERSRLDKVL